ncbi:hypothetical protein TNCV_719701 [Trichonephila clavipes]|nr:hypothetical protein TNCV_719701 [Trichonephila clavipes]
MNFILKTRLETVWQMTPIQHAFLLKVTSLNPYRFATPGLNGAEDDYLFMEESNSDGENDTDFDDVPEDITEDEYADLFMLSNNESS